MQTRYGKRFAAGLMILMLIAAAVLPAGVLRAEAKERTAAVTLCGGKESCSADEKPEIVSVQDGEDVYLLNVAVLENGGYVISEKSSEMRRAYPDQTATASYLHKFYDRNGTLVATLTTVITGLYSQVDGGSSQMLSISGSFSGTLAGDFTYGTSLNGAYGSITAYFNGVSVKTFTYQIDTNGHIEEV